MLHKYIIIIFFLIKISPNNFIIKLINLFLQYLKNSIQFLYNHGLSCWSLNHLNSWHINPSELKTEFSAILINIKDLLLALQEIPKC